MTPRIYQALVIKHALTTYANTGMKVNTAYTPMNMMKMAQRITGQEFTRRDYLGAADALEQWIKENE